MSKIEIPVLLEELKMLTAENRAFAEGLIVESTELLNGKLSAESWSVLECLEHLNRYGRFYLPEIQKCLDSNQTKPVTMYRPGMLGNYFAKSMLPGEQMKRMKTFREMNPAGSTLNRDVLTEFIRQQDELQRLLERSADVDLGKLKTPVSIAKWLSIKLGDTLRFFVYHQVRHVLQAKRVLNSLEKSVESIQG